MEHTHPHAKATYRVIPTADRAFAVEVSIPETYPAKVSPFATKADAEALDRRPPTQGKIRKRAEPSVSPLSSIGVSRRGRPG